MFQTTCVNLGQDHEIKMGKCTLKSFKMSIFITITMMNSSLNTLNHVQYICVFLCVYIHVHANTSLSFYFSHSVAYLEYPSTECPISFSEIRFWISPVAHSLCVCFVYVFHVAFERWVIWHIFVIISLNKCHQIGFIYFQTECLYLPLNDIHLLKIVLNSGFSLFEKIKMELRWIRKEKRRHKKVSERGREKKNHLLW